ncbi:MAG TPA: response regulator [Terriglobia bacterium]|nr:response regulator [Terriglobia bacterium]
MTISFSKQHWMTEVLSDQDWSGVYLPANTPPERAWAAGMTASGLNITNLARKVAAHFRVGLANLGQADLRIRRLIPEKTARNFFLYPLSQDDTHLYIATADPGNLELEKIVTFASGRKPIFRVAPPNAILQAIDGSYLQPQALAPSNLSLVSDGTPKIQPSQPADPTPKPSDENQHHILIADDDAITRRVARSILQKQGYQVSEVADGAAALESIQAGNSFNLIILDLSMPRLGGREVLLKLKSSEATAHIPVIVFTSQGDEDTEAEVFDKGADDYIRKPLDPVRFTARVRAVLRRNAM